MYELPPLARKMDAKPLKAHGTEYNTMTAVSARITELEFANRVYGASDGRVTEVLLIWNALHDYAEELGAIRPDMAVQLALSNQTYLTANDAPVLSIQEELEIAVANDNNKRK